MTLKRIYLRTGHIFVVKKIIEMNDDTIAIISVQKEEETIKLNSIEKTIWKRKQN